MQCNVCKKEIAEKYVFCPNCGNQLKSNIVQSNTNIVNKTVDNLNKNKSKKKKKHPFLKFLLTL